MNVVILTGRFIKDPDVRENVTRFCLAVQRDFKNSEGNYDADFLNCVSFGKTAEFVAKYFTKGMKMSVVGRLQSGSYTNRDGNTVHTTDVVVDKCEFVESKNVNEAAQKETTQVNKAQEEFLNIPNDVSEELPFN